MSTIEMVQKFTYVQSAVPLRNNIRIFSEHFLVVVI